MIGSIIVYFGSTIIISILGDYFINSKSARKQYTGMLIVCLLLALAAAFRGETGADSAHYIFMYNTPERYFLRTDVEIGFKVLMYICHMINPNYMFLFGVMGFLTSWFIVLSIKEHKDLISCKVSLFVFILSFYWLTFNIMRQGVAVALSLYAVTLYLKDKKWQAILIIMIAGSFHVSALLCIVLPVLYEFSKSRYFKSILTIMLLILTYVVFNREIISEFMERMGNIFGFSIFFSLRYTHYITSVTEDNSHALIVTILRFLPIILICTMALRSIFKDRRMRIYYAIMCIGYIISLLGALTGTQAERIGYSFIYLNIILLGAAANTELRIGRFYFKKSVGRNIIYIVTIVLFAYVRLYRNYAELVPYGLGVFKG